MVNTETPADVVLKPCPFCGHLLRIWKGANTYGRCETDDCWMRERKTVVPLDDPDQVAAWNTRITPPGEDHAAEGALRTAIEENAAKAIATEFAPRPWDEMPKDQDELRMWIKENFEGSFYLNEPTQEACLAVANHILFLTAHPAALIKDKDNG